MGDGSTAEESARDEQSGRDTSLSCPCEKRGKKLGEGRRRRGEKKTRVEFEDGRL